MKAKIILRAAKWVVPGVILGTIAGYLYYHFWGCGGTCFITSSPWRSMLYGAVMGGLINILFKPAVKPSDSR